MRLFRYFLFLVSILSFGYIFFFQHSPTHPKPTQKSLGWPTIVVPELASTGARAFYSGALTQVGVVKVYDFSNGYYGNGGYPPSGTGVCSDVIWRAFQSVGLDFKALLEADITKNPDLYPGNHDSNINFRRVKNINVFLSKKAKTLTNEMIFGDVKNLAEWQMGDIVVFDQLLTSKLWHIGIITDQRLPNGVPYMLDNHGYGVSILMTPLDWDTKIVGHYRYF